MSKHRRAPGRSRAGGLPRHRGRSAWAAPSGQAGLRSAGLLAIGAVIVTVTQDPWPDTSSPGGVAPLATATTVPAGSSGSLNREVTISRSTNRATSGTSRPDSSSATTRQATAKAEERRRRALESLTKQADRRVAELLSDQWVWPLEQVSITATFGASGRMWSARHTGVDFDGVTGDSIRSISGGTVTSAGWDGPYGNKTVITTDEGLELWYCHQSAILVSEGARVSPGQVIGSVGSTGNVTGSHLHLEARPGGGEPIDPMGVLAANGLA